MVERQTFLGKEHWTVVDEDKNVLETADSFPDARAKVIRRYAQDELASRRTPQPAGWDSDWPVYDR
jgi:hypothetical protein